MYDHPSSEFVLLAQNFNRVTRSDGLAQHFIVYFFHYIQLSLVFRSDQELQQLLREQCSLGRGIDSTSRSALIMESHPWDYRDVSIHL